MTTVACVGIAVEDVILTVDELPRAAGKYYASAQAEVGGGVAATAAVAITRLGGRAAFVGRLGDDDRAARIIAGLASEGVDTSRVQTMPGVASPVSVVLVDSDGERLIVNHSPAELFHGGDVDSLGRLGDVDAVLVDVRWPEGARRALDAAAAGGIPGVFDFDRPMAAGGDELLARASHVAFSHDALDATAGTADPEEGLLIMRQRTDAWLAVTHGAAGVWWSRGGAVRHLPAFPVSVVDTVGAGDVFHGALALALGEGRDEAEAVRFAAAAAALKCTRPGGRAGTPGRLEVDRFLAEAG